MSRLQGKVAIVTGGAQGIGEGIALAARPRGRQGRHRRSRRRQGEIGRPRDRPERRQGDRTFRRRRRARPGPGGDPGDGEGLRPARRLFQQRRLQQAAAFPGSRRGQFQRDHARQRLGRPRRHAGSRPADDRARARAARSSTPPRSPDARAMRNSRLIARARRRSSRSPRPRRANSPDTRSPSTPSRPAWSSRRCGTGSSRT